MDVSAEKEHIEKYPSQSIMLVKQVRREMNQLGKTTVICPKCGKTPEVITTSKGERTIIKCDCKYIYDMEINL